jgi:hypothetical protein
VVTVIVDDPLPASEGGLKLALAPDGRPEVEKVTVPVKPFEGVMVTV